MFEARFAGYTTKQELQQIYHMLFDYTKQEQTDRLIHMIKSFENRCTKCICTKLVRNAVGPSRESISCHRQ